MDDDGSFVGYGTWQHVHALGPLIVERHIEIAWFGIDVRYQGRTDQSGYSLAGRLYATIESAALAHASSSADMPFTLVCHVDNQRGLAFWHRQGYRAIENADARIEDDFYYRMVR